jgi:hypothetical protein
MSDEEQQVERQVTGERPSGWFAFQEKPVMIQLREGQPYWGVNPAYEPVTKNGDIVAVPVLRGILHVEPDGAGGVMLVVQMPTGNGNDFALVTVRPADVLYCTHIHQSMIVT